MAVRRLHIRRFADIVMGSAINGAKTAVQKLALRKSIDVSKGRGAFNDFIRDNSPTIYLVDPSLITHVIIETIKSDPKYLKSIRIGGNISYAEDADFSEQFGKVDKLLDSTKTELIQAIDSDLRKVFSTVTLKSFTSLVEEVYNNLIKDIQKAESRGRSYISFQVAAARAGSEIRRKLNTLKVSILEDGDQLISNINSRIPFVGYRFSGTVSEINKVIQKSITTIISSKIGDINFNVGNLVHAGHVGIYSDQGLLGINMPSGLIAGLVSNRLQEIESAIGNLPLHIENGIKLNTNYTEKAGVLLDLQFNFAVSMPESINSQILGKQEQEAINSIISNITNEELQKALRKQLGEGSLNNIIEQVAASPSIEEYVFNLIKNTLAGKTTSSLKHRVDAKAVKDLARGQFKQSGKPKKIKISGPKTITTRPISATGRIITSPASLSNLQTLINRDLAEQIRSNMGSGNRTDVLNYRTGRFANSVKVEKLSESRQGMITAFYSYMKNPYATFSQGGLQELPRSRDPKLLISKSIREIAQSMVTNRMRAVSL